MSVTSIESVDTFLILERHKPITTTEQVNVNEGNVEEYHYDKIFKVSQYTVLSLILMFYMYLVIYQTMLHKYQNIYFIDIYFFF